MSERPHFSLAGLTPAEAAAAWLARHDRGLTPAEEGEFAAWRDADPRHAEEYAQLATEWEGFDLAKRDPELAAMARELDQRTRGVSSISPARRQATHGRVFWFTALAAAAAVMVMVSLWRRQPANEAHAGTITYQVVPSSARQLRLEDGSIVALRGDSEIATDFTPAERRVRLVRGEAHFTVTKNPNRPFIVSAGGVAVRAVGTAFNVRLGPASIEVLVTEGRVGVNDAAGSRTLLPTTESAAPVLTAGQRVVIDAATLRVREAAPRIDAVTAADMEQALAWQTTRLVFNRTPLREAVAAFNRHENHGHRLMLGTDALGDRLLGGTFRADNVDGFVRLLQLTADVRVEQRGDGTLVLWPAH